MTGFRQTDIDFDVLGFLAGQVRIRARGRVEITRRPARAADRPPAPTVRDFVVPGPVRLAHAIADAAIVRDAAAFGALILFATLFAVL